MRLAAGLALLLAASSCGRRENVTPEQAVLAFVSAMEQSRHDPQQRRHAYELLSGPARAGLVARAQRASQLSGREMEPWEMLAPGRWQLRFHVDPEALTARIEGARAIVTVRGSQGAVADVPLVREGDRWHVALELPPMASDPPLRDR